MQGIIDVVDFNARAAGQPIVSTKHLDTYLDELEFRFDNRENPHMFREALCKPLVAENLPYDKLIAG